MTVDTGGTMKSFLRRAAIVGILGGAAAVGSLAFAAQTPHADADVGYLDVSSDPPAKIVIDELDTGKTTPYEHLALKAGRHKLTLTTADGGRKRTLGFTIDAGQTTKLSVHLAPVSSRAPAGEQ
jgi:hypothetical protein